MKKFKLLAAVLMATSLTVFAAGCGSTEEKAEETKEPAVESEVKEEASDKLIADKGILKAVRDITGKSADELTEEDLATIESLVIVGNKAITDEALVAEIVASETVEANDWNNYIKYTVNGEEKKIDMNFAIGSVKSLDDLSKFANLKNVVILVNDVYEGTELPEGVSLDKLVLSVPADK